jgi:7-keto-8-aminopelargonate synthetase-like enzyme
MSWLKQRVHIASTFAKNDEELGIAELRVESWNGRELVIDDGRVLLDFLTCSYLGLDMHPNVVGAVQNFKSEGMSVQLASARTRVVSKSTRDLEGKLAQLFGAGGAVTFTSTTMVHMGILPLLTSGSLPHYDLGGQRPLILIDKHAHASIQALRAIMLQFGDIEICSVFDVEDVRRRVKAANARGAKAIVLTDGVFSYDGLAPVAQLRAMADEEDCILYIDDAHGVSIIGEHGEGLAVQELGGKLPRNCILAISMAKGFGTGGAAICFADEETARFARQHASTYVFSGPPFQPLVQASLASADLHLSGAIAPMQARLWQNVATFDALWDRKEFNTGLQTPIRTIAVGCEARASDATYALQQAGLLVASSSYPRVAKGLAVLRICISALHTPEQIARLVRLMRRELAPATDRATGTGR